ncbi:MAG: hypothetical protein IKQ71_07780 [Lachnospiraceae bacterium]|nr:hypothetical protein [Lachnospiraceae bacterium]
MTKGIRGNEPDPREVYKDIIDLPYKKSDKHQRMSLYDRAAQFAPFAALSGYEEMISDQAQISEKEADK